MSVSAPERETDDPNHKNSIHVTSLEEGASLPSADELRLECQRLSELYGLYNKKPNKRKRSILLWAIAISIIILLLVAMAVVGINAVKHDNGRQQQSSSSSDHSPTSDEKTEQSTSRNSSVQEVIAYIVEQDIGSTEYDFLSNNTTGKYYQYRAVLFLAIHDGANLPVPRNVDKNSLAGFRYLFRYIMALNFYALRGTNWRKDMGFLSPHDICDWYTYDSDAGTNKGVTCDKYGRPVWLNLAYNNLQGKLPKENEFLMDTLVEFDIQGNSVVTPSDENEQDGYHGGPNY